ncbi:MAG: hypothetical protein K2P78_09145 [Gemmataceae bacterium]|nr:hypothetical protein [Gemmataceae bacterium]
MFAFKNGQLTATATMNLDAGDKVGAYGIVVTADYYVTRDGSGLVGVVTGMDVVLDGACATEPEMLKAVEDLGKAQKCLVGQPFCCTFRIHDDTLMVGDLRLAVAKDSPFGGDEVAMIAGRYKAAGPNGVPKAKPMKTKTAERAGKCDAAPVEVRAAEVLPVMPPPVQLGVPVGGGRYVQVPALGAAVGTAANPAVVQVQRVGVDFTDVPPTARPAVAPQWWWAENPTILLPGK